MWVQLSVCKQIDVHGKLHNKQPGDWVNVPARMAQTWLERGDAVAPDYSELAADLPDCGIVALGLSRDEAAARLHGFEEHIELRFEDGLFWPRTLRWDRRAPLRVELLPTGFRLLGIWEVAVPLVDYHVLAQDIGTLNDRRRTAEVIRDLRVPVYDTRLMFLRDTPDVRKLLAYWHSATGNRELAFLCALYVVKPLVLALPPTWMNPHYETDA